jgi:two-component system, cell cycle response regulator
MSLPLSMAPQGRGKVLVVDDVEANRELLSQDLEEEGFEVASVASGPECLRAARANPPHVILLDIQMAGMDGIETCGRLKADPSTMHIPVLFVTANRADDETAVRALEAGGNDFLPKPYSPLILVARVTCQVTIARAHARLRRLAMTDELTGVYSRRHLFESMRHIVKTRPAGTVACLLADVDHFKAINDTRGHIEGDRVLRQIARAMASSVRETDLVARYGGEEFAVLLPQTDLAGALAIGENVRAAVADGCTPVTISIGAAVLDDEDLTGDLDPASVERLVTKLLKKADAATYRAKSAGRNRVEPAAA